MLMNTSMKSFTNNRKKSVIILISLILLLPIVIAVCVSIGATSISLGKIFTLFSLDTSSAEYRIIMHVRIPRALGAIVSGSALAAAGAIIQSVLNNPLASPNIIGVNTGAGLFVLIFSALFGQSSAFLPLAAFLGAVITSLIIIVMSFGGSTSKLTLVLTGIAISSIMTAGMNTIMIINPDAYIGASTFLIGGLAGLTLNQIALPSVYIAVGLLLSCSFCKDMNILALGDNTASSLGMRVNFKRVILVIIAALLAGAAVSFAGLIGFVGLIVPHAVRFIIGSDNHFVLPISAIGGGMFVLVCDTVARAAFSPYELPVGIIMALVGGPFFIYLIVRDRLKKI